ncbi:hypothetical protein [Corynebacterium sp.]|uniref:hypothetical protein n=1 Tax=Corynebacterium sp. TaxID=1720 RepID=UPI0026DFE08C|nr:hypothetical protein [Corynebacterium sp.]MDO5512511.1 hypothetical protein [Corynebacterium sp.]
MPLWRLTEIAEPDPDLIVRLTLMGDSFFGEYTLEEFRYHCAVADLETLCDLYREFYAAGAFKWHEEQRVHEEIRPLAEYIGAARSIPRLSEPTLLEQRAAWPQWKLWGARRTPVEEWEL